MTLINAITLEPSQKITLVLPDGTTIPLSLVYMDNCQGWFFSLSYKTIQINNMRLVVSPNILRQFRRVIPFGLAVDTTDGYENLFVNDFSTGRASLYLLDADDVLAVERIIQNVNQVAT